MVTPCGEAVHAVIGANAGQLEICGRFWDVPMDLVSVVIPAYNSEKWIKATLNGVLAQSHHELESNYPLPFFRAQILRNYPQF